MERLELEHWKRKEVARLLSLVETERRYYQEMLAALPAPLVVLSADRSVVSANRAFRQAFGLRADELHGKTIEQILPSDRLIEKIRDVMIHGIAQPGFLLQMEEKLLRIAIVPMRGTDDEAEAETLLMISDVTDVAAGRAGGVATTAAPATRTATAVSAFPVDDLPAVVWRASASTLAFSAVNGATERIFGYPESHWLRSPNFFTGRIHPEDREAVLALYQSAIAANGDASAEFRVIAASGDAVWCRESIRVSATGVITGVLVAAGQRKQLDQQRVTAARSAAIQGLSARLAHDLNNPLMIITGYAEELLHGVPEKDPRRADVEQILAATQRIGQLTGQLLQFTRKQALAAQPVNLSALLTGLEEKICETAGEPVVVEIDAGETVWAMGSREQLEEIVRALVSPGREGAGPRSRLTITCGTATIREQIEASPLQPGRYAEVSIQDNGPGLDAAKQMAVFESIVSKDAEKTPGTALARAYAIVREWSGDIVFSSEPSRGSMFTVYLPLAHAEPGAAKAKPVAAKTPPAAPRRETILVVDDEAGIRGLVTKILQREGYTVLEAASAEDAVAVASAHEGTLDLLVTDVMLPGRTGRQLAEQLREALPKLKVLYISGFTGDESIRGGKLPPGTRFLQKPFALEALVRSVRESLAG
jgi:two-component system cell cycle sensor histidine kinase/response regulator CckA